MAKGRFVAATIATDKRLNGLSVESEYLYLKAIPHLDRDGLISGDVLWATACPRRPEFMAKIADLVAEWEQCGLVFGYDTDEGRVLWFAGFSKNQQGMRYERESPSRFQLPPDEILNKSGFSPDEVRSYSGVTPDEVPHKINVNSNPNSKGNLNGNVTRNTSVTGANVTPTERGGEDGRASRSEAYKAFERITGRTINPATADEIDELCAIKGIEELERALRLSVTNNANYPLKYARQVLLNEGNPPAKNGKKEELSFAELLGLPAGHPARLDA